MTSRRCLLQSLSIRGSRVQKKTPSRCVRACACARAVLGACACPKANVSDVCVCKVHVHNTCFRVRARAAMVTSVLSKEVKDQRGHRRNESACTCVWCTCVRVRMPMYLCEPVPGRTHSICMRVCLHGAHRPMVHTGLRACVFGRCAWPRVLVCDAHACISPGFCGCVYKCIVRVGARVCVISLLCAHKLVCACARAVVSDLIRCTCLIEIGTTLTCALLCSQRL